jgi:hypothetical protein
MQCTSLTVLAIALCACGGGGSTSIFPDNYASSYVQVRDCRSSGDHDLNHIRILADPLAVDAYRMRDRPFPTGAVVLKEEYDFSDDTCTGPIKQWTVMVQLAADTAASTLDWHWQKVDLHGDVVTDNEPRCYGCHATCGVAPDGYKGTCAVP